MVRVVYSEQEEDEKAGEVVKVGEIGEALTRGPLTFFEKGGVVRVARMLRADEDVLGPPVGEDDIRVLPVRWTGDRRDGVSRGGAIA